MSQNRFWLSSHDEYAKAHEAKADAQIAQPEGVFQIRKGKDKYGGTIFRVVQRFKSKEADTIINNKTKEKKRKKKDADLSWIRG